MHVSVHWSPQKTAMTHRVLSGVSCILYVMHPEAILLKLAAEQGGVIRRSQAHDLGVSDRQIAARTRSGRWLRIPQFFRRDGRAFDFAAALRQAQENQAAPTVFLPALSVNPYKFIF